MMIAMRRRSRSAYEVWATSSSPRARLNARWGISDIATLSGRLQCVWVIGREELTEARLEFSRRQADWVTADLANR